MSVCSHRGGRSAPSLPAGSGELPFCTYPHTSGTGLQSVCAHKRWQTGHSSGRVVQSVVGNENADCEYVHMCIYTCSTVEPGENWGIVFLFLSCSEWVKWSWEGWVGWVGHG